MFSPLLSLSLFHLVLALPGKPLQYTSMFQRNNPGISVLYQVRMHTKKQVIILELTYFTPAPRNVY